MYVCSYFPNRLGYADDDWKEDIGIRVGLEYRIKNLSNKGKYIINDLFYNFDKIFFNYTEQLKYPLYKPTSIVELILFSRLPKPMDSDFKEYVLEKNEIFENAIINNLNLDIFDLDNQFDLDNFLK